MKITNKIFSINNLIIVLAIFYLILSFPQLKKTFALHKIGFLDRLYINHINAKTFIKIKLNPRKQYVYFIRQINYFTESLYVKRAMDFHYYWELEQGKKFYGVSSNTLFRISYQAEQDLKNNDIKIENICPKFTDDSERHFHDNLDNNVSNNIYFNNNLLQNIKFKFISNEKIITLRIKDKLSSSVLAETEINLENHYTTYNGIPIHHSPIKNYSNKIFILDSGTSGDWYVENNDKSIRHLWLLLLNVNNIVKDFSVEIITKDANQYKSKLTNKVIRSIYCSES